MITSRPSLPSHGRTRPRAQKLLLIRGVHGFHRKLGAAERKARPSRQYPVCPSSPSQSRSCRLGGRRRGCAQGRCQCMHMREWMSSRIEIRKQRNPQTTSRSLPLQYRKPKPEKRIERSRGSRCVKASLAAHMSTYAHTHTAHEKTKLPELEGRRV